MNISKQKGNFGEHIARRYVTNKGMKIVASNYHSKYGEIDIICKDGEFIVFIEVKTIKKISYIGGAERVDRRKQVKIIKTAYLYIQENHVNLQPRFDVIEIKYDNKIKTVRISYINNAFDLEVCDEFF